MRGRIVKVAPSWEDLDVIGGRLHGRTRGELPRRLRPVARDRRTGTMYLIWDEMEPPSLGVWSVEKWVSDCEAGDAIEVVPRQVRQGYWLMHLHPGEQPDYDSPDFLKQRIAEEGKKAIERVEDEFSRNHGETAREWASYAANALPDDPLPCLLLVALWRGDLDDGGMWLYQRELGRFKDVEVGARWREIQKTGSCLARLLGRDKVLHERYFGAVVPSWAHDKTGRASRYRSVPGFQCMALP